MTRLAVVLFNLGGPDRLESVEPFLFNLFNDRAIIALPQPLRAALAFFLARRRARIARPIYAKMGGGSPLLANTQDQARALERALGAELDDYGEIKVFACMRYWHPMSAGVRRAIDAFAADRLVLVPLYPQFSTTTTGSSLEDWRRATGAGQLGQAVCCYPDEPGWIEALAARAGDGLDRLAGQPKIRLLFTAHGLPKRVIERGDPYAWQVERTCQAVIARLNRPNLDWVLAYQSQVGPLEWIGPSTPEEVARAGRDKAALVVVPVAFVSEHSETLVELDIEYRHLAEVSGVPAYHRVPTVGTHPAFIGALAALVRRRIEGRSAAAAPAIVPGNGSRLCPARATGCALAGGG